MSADFLPKGPAASMVCNARIGRSIIQRRHVQALVAGTRAERSMVLRRAFASAAGAVAKYAAPARVDKLVAEAVAVFTEPGVLTRQYS